MRRPRPCLALLAVLVAQAATAGALLAVGRVRGLLSAHDLMSLTHRAPAEDAITAAGWFVAFALAIWLLTATLLSTATLAFGAARLHARVDRYLPPYLRAIVDRAFAVSLTATAVLGIATPGAHASTGANVATPTTHTSASFEITHEGQLLFVAPEGRNEAGDPAPNGDEPVVRAPAPPPAAPEVAPPRTPTPPHTAAADTPPLIETAGHHVVVAGDSLWRIAAEQLRAVRGAEPTDAQIAPYWRRVIDANRATLRSGNPNLIFPGEVVALPHVEV